MTTTWKTVSTTLSGLLSLTVLAGIASAGCGYEPEQRNGGSKVQLTPAAFVLVDNDQDPIVGMWKVHFIAGGETFDFGYSQWHGDGTEILNSGSRAPATENFCLGVWKKTGHDTYKLNHFALSYDAASGQQNASVNIREFVTLDRSGNSYAGTFTVDVFTPGGVQVAHIEGTITGERVTAD